MEKEKVIFWERVDNPEKNKIGVYKRIERVLHVTKGGEYYIYYRNSRAYIGFYDDNTNNVYVRYYLSK